MQDLTQDILTTKITKATKGSGIFNYKLRALRVLRGHICFSRLTLFGWGLRRTRSFVVKTFFLLRYFIFVSAIPLLCAARLLAQEPLRAGTIFSATQAPLWAAKEGRFFEKYGIKNLEVIQFSGGQPVTRALIGGDIQISTTGGAAVVNARLKGADTVIIARTVGVFPYTLYVSKDIRNAGRAEREKTCCQHRWRVRLRGDAICS